MKNNILREEIKSVFLKNIIKLNYVISCNLVGSYLNKKKINLNSDIDIVVIVDSLKKKKFEEIINTVKKKFISSKYFKEYNLYINSSFGPLKYRIKNTLILHLMIYDLKGHLNHTISSPFTCYDWERSNLYEGDKLNTIFPIGNLQFIDFLNARRGIINYLDNLDKLRIEYQIYNFQSNKYSLIKKYKKISEINSQEFIYHIVNNLINNLNKLLMQKNIKINKIKFKILFMEITSNDLKFYETYKSIERTKVSNKPITNLLTKLHIKKTIGFIKKFQIHLDYHLKNSYKVIFMRHAKTKLNNKIFIGQLLDPNIIKIKNNYSKFKNINICFSSPLKRSLETAKKFYRGRIIKDKLLQEINYGLVEGKNIDYLNKTFPLIIKKWSLNKDERFPKGENYYDLNKRINIFLKQQIFKNYDKNILVITHNVFLRTLLGNYFKIKRNIWFKINIKYLDSFEFIILNKKMISNINRKKLLLTYKDIA